MSGLVLLYAAGLLLAAPSLPPEGVTVQIVQRHGAPVPGTDGAWEIRLDDITRGQVFTVVAPTGQSALPPFFAASVQPDVDYPFMVEGHRYFLRAEKMVNYLIGDDFAVLRVRPDVAVAAPSAPSPGPHRRARPPQRPFPSR